ncbi:MAG: undecaprenyl-diphosphate phosphatase [Ferruginibacter sp.]|nr:undecaprenyl-diphosphate phosphatase [Ferruginibacter sp.]
MDIFQTILIAVVEGLTEFIPVSSTGHMIITEKLLHLPDNDYTKMFTVAIQLGAILAVVVLYRKKFFDFKNIPFYFKLFVGVIPAIILGLLFSKKIDALLESTSTVAISLLLGGIVLLFIDKIFKHNTVASEKKITYLQSFIIGIWQCLAMVPGVSRSAASIIGGMQQKLTRSEAAEFSFFLAVPTMLAATGYKLLKHYKEAGGFTGEEIKQLAVGNLVAFVVALLAIRFFIGFVKKYGFRIWGIYRIILGVVLLVLIWKGVLQ